MIDRREFFGGCSGLLLGGMLNKGNPNLESTIPKGKDLGIHSEVAVNSGILEPTTVIDFRPKSGNGNLVVKRLVFSTSSTPRDETVVFRAVSDDSDLIVTALNARATMMWVRSPEELSTANSRVMITAYTPSGTYSLPLTVCVFTIIGPLK